MFFTMLCGGCYIQCWCTDPEKVVRGHGGYWNCTIIAESEEKPGQQPQVVVAKLKVRGLATSYVSHNGNVSSLFYHVSSGSSSNIHML